jgi:hypothetical protein
MALSPVAFGNGQERFPSDLGDTVTGFGVVEFAVGSSVVYGDQLRLN